MACMSTVVWKINSTIAYKKEKEEVSCVGSSHELNEETEAPIVLLRYS